MSDVDPAHFRRAMGRFATGVTVLSTRAEGHDHAMTANSVTSVSLDPVLLLACVEVDSRFHDAVLEAGVWGVSVLGHEARATAAWLATRGRPLFGQLDRIPYHRGGATGVALLDDAHATFECRTHEVFPGGDHVIVVGEVLAVATSEHADAPLLYHRGTYRNLG